MTSLAVARQKRYLERQRRGEVVIGVVVDEATAVERLRLAGFLAETDAANRAALAVALQRIVDVWLSNDASIVGAP